MNIEMYNGETKIIENKQSIRKTIPMDITVCNRTQDLEVTLLYDEYNNDELQRSLYGFQVSGQPLQKHCSGEEGKTVDFGLLIQDSINEWFDGCFSFSTPEENFEVNSTSEQAFEKVWEIIEQENLA